MGEESVVFLFLVSPVAGCHIFFLDSCSIHWQYF